MSFQVVGWLWLVLLPPASCQSIFFPSELGFPIHGFPLILARGDGACFFFLLATVVSQQVFSTFIVFHLHFVWSNFALFFGPSIMIQARCFLFPMTLSQNIFSIVLAFHLLLKSIISFALWILCVLIHGLGYMCL